MGTSSDKENSIQGQSPVIFVVTGTQEPFDRLVKIIDEWAQQQNKYKVIGQIAKTTYQPKAITSFDFIDPYEFSNIFNNAEIIIGHAGMGTIIKALENEKKIIVFPRLAKYKEHRNDHQIHTAKSFEEMGSIYVAYTEAELLSLLTNIGSIKPLLKIEKNAQKSLINCIANFINR
jgi:UDP-N-acetylglucosamine transferase subunit ALG13